MSAANPPSKPNHSVEQGHLPNFSESSKLSPGPIALVTGAAVRVGRAIVESLSAANYRVWIHYHRSQTEAFGLKEELGPAAIGLIQADLSDPVQRQGLIEAVSDPSGPGQGSLSLLVNSAATFESGSFLDRNDDDLRRVMEINFFAPLALTRGLVSAMLSPRSSSPCVINIVDLGAIHPWPQYLDHCTSKAALAMATRALAVELAPDIRVNAIAPGPVLWPDTNQFQVNSTARHRIIDKVPLGDCGHPKFVGDSVLFFARNAYITGQVLAVDGGRTANFDR